MADRYRDFSIPQLRKILDDRGVDMRNARTRRELINLLVQADIRGRTADLFVGTDITTMPFPGPLRQPTIIPIQPVNRTPTMTQNIIRIPSPVRNQIRPISPVRGPVNRRLDFTPTNAQWMTPIAPPDFNTVRDDMRRPSPLETQIQPQINMAPGSPYRAPAVELSQRYMTLLKGPDFGKNNYPSFDLLPYRTRTINITWGDAITTENLYNDNNLRVLIGNDRYIVDPVGYLMLQGDSNILSTLLTELGFSNLIADEDVCYNLLWYIRVALYNRNLVSKPDRAILSGMTDQQLLTLLGPTYSGPHDKAALLFAAISGRSIYKPAITDLPRYQKVKQYPSSNTWYIAQFLYNIIHSEEETVSPYGPYVHIAIQLGNIVEEIMSRVRPNNVETFMRRYAMISNINELRRNNVNLFQYFMNMILYYEPVLTRGANVQPIPDSDITQLDEDDVIKMLATYTVDELVNFYEVTGIWNMRIQLIRRIRDDYKTEPHWAFRNRYCNNDDMFNVVEGEPRGDINKNNPDDPTITYGLRGNYACYQTSELTGSFHEDNNGIFQFYNPDWSPTKVSVNRVFTLESMKQLREILSDLDNKVPTVIALELKVQEGISAAQNVGVLVGKLRDEYDTMSPYQQKLVQLYLGWLFYYGMWLRFWKGPGNPWPLQWIEHRDDDRCILEVRDAQTVIQQGIGYLIVQNASQEPGLQQWLEALPLVDYDFHTGEARVATKGAARIKQILDPISKANFCLANGSDLILRDAYFLITTILQVNNQDFDDFLQTILKSLYDYEYGVVSSRLDNPDNEQPEDLKVLSDRQQVLRQQIPVLPPLPIRQIRNTGHIDPELGRQIAFA